MVKKNTFKTFVSEIPKNLFAGFVVSLIALPLGLGLALASGAPPISGIIAAIIGGTVTALLGGSNVTITGPGNGLVVVILGAITSLGAGDMHQGFLYTLAAIVISGVLLIILGFLRMGALGDFFPSSAIQGMLAAIGIGIFAKQIHVMFGNLNAKGSILELLFQTPKGVLDFLRTDNSSIFWAGSVGVISLLIMVFYGKIRNKYFQLIPAPMWIVVLNVGMFYYFDLFSNTPYPIHKELLINLPNDVLANFAFPDFGKVYHIDFISAVISITLIASIESLLSIKAVDKLDTQKRRSNVNKDIRALGLATVISGFLGGLNVVTVIARSSVNVNNNGTNRSANFFHSAFLVIFILLFASELRKIPLPALAAILVYTGYKLASPENIKKVFKIGREQLVIFLITLLTTITTSLITGILVGIIATFIIHIIINKNIALFARNIFKPNVLMFKEDEKYFVSVENFSSFLNYTKLKSKLDQIPENEDAIVDFSLCDFVDHSVMENMNNYAESFERKGGHFELIGLDGYKTGSEHPFALRKNTFNQIKESEPALNAVLTKRQKSLQNISTELNWNYTLNPSEKIKELPEFGYFKTRKINKVSNILSNENCSLFDIEFSEGELIAKQVIKATMLHINLEEEVPQFTLDREGFFEYIYHFAGFEDIHIDHHPDFSKRFYLSGKDTEGIKQFFSDELILFFESNEYYHIEANKKSLLIIGNERLAGVKEIKALADYGIRLKKVVKSKSPILV
ncbi:SulP family inorganic anion transporter [Tenacibaculum maritimum]|uniref:SulP family inorganic anion transporter n=1 Tax=Tenacibaculum maritimum TaxID=107401 RepID=UPI0012E51048|nr:SulP family inorganic anion transporter [Tenacibaculum maritimum]MCD9582598.1 SulP family inorganic anion transporter [Tenacibaculum maritimum]MCD9635429.1 SulP family inorganic anion transporter [Tenacibaculum maritimum]CAA0178755.1 sulfate transporter family protein [Tenacibaculum maritimum]CAA0185096.1 sulfate transporter family protein [Tenacibaculum maritimum]